MQLPKRSRQPSFLGGCCCSLGKFCVHSHSLYLGHWNAEFHMEVQDHLYPEKEGTQTVPLFSHSSVKVLKVTDPITPSPISLWLHQNTWDKICTPLVVRGQLLPC